MASTKYLRLARLIELISVVKYHPDWGPKRLAGYFEISEKRLYDDIAELNAANVPIVYNGRGYSFLSPPVLPPVRFTADEAMSLIMARHVLEQHDEDVYSQAVRSAAAKLLQLLPDNYRAILLSLEGRVSMATKGRTSANHALKALNESIAAGETVSFNYDSYSGGKISKRRVSPYAVAFRGNSWYLVGHCHLRGETRTFRLNRISKLTRDGERFDYPKDFSIEKYLADSWAIFQGAPTRVVVRFSTKVAPLIREHEWQPDQILVDEPGGGVRFEATVRGEIEIRRWALSWGADAEILEPESLREETAKIAKEMAEKYKPKKVKR